MEEAPTQEEHDLLVKLADDGWPLTVITTQLDEAGIARFQQVALSLVRKGLAGVYGRPEDARHVSLTEAERILADPDCWGGMWMINTTEAGNALLGTANQWWPPQAS